MENSAGKPDFSSNAFAALADQYRFAVYSNIGKSMLGREIPMLRIGRGEKSVLFVAGADARDGISEEVLVTFAAALCRDIAEGRKLHGMHTAYLSEHRSLYFLPRINPDGRALCLFGADPGCPLYERQLRQNGMKSDFSLWQGNARGVEPGLNFNFEFAKRKKLFLESGGSGVPPMGEAPESEPESAAVATLVRTICPFCLVEIGLGSASFSCLQATTSQKNYISRATGLDCANESHSILGSWFSSEYRRPSLFFAAEGSAQTIYVCLQQALLRTTTLFCAR